MLLVNILIEEDNGALLPCLWLAFWPFTNG